MQLDASLKGRFNPLDAIDPLSDFAVDDAGRVAASLVVSDGGQSDRFFEDSALNLVKGLILHVLTDPDFEGRRNLVTVWRLVNQGDWLTVEVLRRGGRTEIPSAFDLLWQGMRQSTHYSGLIAGLGEEMLSMSDRTRDSIRKTAATHLDFIGGAPMQRVLEASDFGLDEIKTSPRGMTIYLTLPQRYMKTHFRWLRLMTDLAVGEMERIKGRPATGYPTLFILDEFAGLKRMEVIEHAAAQAAGFGAKFFFVVQSLVQLKDVYKDSWETFLGNAGLKLYFNIEDDFTRSYLSRQLGEREVRRKTETSSLTQAQGVTTTDGRSTTMTTGSSDSTTSGESQGVSTTRSSGSSSGNTTNFNNAFLIGGFKTGTGSSTSSNWSHSTGQNSSYSKSLTRSTQTSRADGVSASESKSNTESSTAGWSDTVHKRLLLNPDEIGRFFAPVSNSDHPAYPGLAGALIIGEHPVLVRRVNYYQSARFSGFFDPHPDHEPPPTLEELAERAKPKALPKPSPQSTIPRYVEPQLNFVEDSRPSWTPVILSIVGIALVAVIAVVAFAPSKNSSSTNYSSSYQSASINTTPPSQAITPPTTSAPAAPITPDYQAIARSKFDQVWVLLSSPTEDDIIDRMKSLYENANPPLYNGKHFDYLTIVFDNLFYMHSWPNRSFHVIENTMSVDCINLIQHNFGSMKMDHGCVFSGNAQFQLSDPSRKRRSSGIADFKIQVSVSDDGQFSEISYQYLHGAYE